MEPGVLELPDLPDLIHLQNSIRLLPAIKRLLADANFSKSTPSGAVFHQAISEATELNVLAARTCYRVLSFFAEDQPLGGTLILQQTVFRRPGIAARQETKKPYEAQRIEQQEPTHAYEVRHRYVSHRHPLGSIGTLNACERGRSTGGMPKGM